MMSRLLMVAGLLLLPGLSLAQDERDLQRENAELRARMKVLEARLEAMEKLLREQAVQLEELKTWAALQGKPGAQTRPQADGPLPLRERRRRQLVEVWKKTRERRGKKHPATRDMGSLLEVLGKDADFAWLREKLAGLRKKLGAEHEGVQGLANGLEQMQKDFMSGEIEPLLETWRRVRPHLRKLEQLEGGSGLERDEAKDVRRYRELKRKHAVVVAEDGKDSPRARELAQAAEAALNVVGKRLAGQVEELARRLRRELDARLAALHEETVAQEHDAERKLAASSMALEEAISKHGEDSVDVERLRNRHEELKRVLDRRMRSISAEARAARKRGEAEVAREVARAEREVRQRLARLARWRPDAKKKDEGSGKKDGKSTGKDGKLF